MRAVMTCVDYSDILSITLPYNRHHFTEVWIATTPADKATQRVAEANDAHLHITEEFYQGGAEFRKWLALESCLDAMGRYGWICIMDADILWPNNLLVGWVKIPCIKHSKRFELECPACNSQNATHVLGKMKLQVGNLYTPLRRMLDDPKRFTNSTEEVVAPPEDSWDAFPRHPQQKEWAGYTQIFHAEDPALGAPPWHETNWRTAGGADSAFQAKWSCHKKLRPPFECLHLGPAGTNWAGRVSPLLDGTVLPKAEERQKRLRELMQQRRGKQGEARFAAERIP